MATATVSATKLRPLGDRVVIQPSAREEMTKSGIVLPDTAKEKPQEGEILAVGPGAFDNDGKRVAMDVKVGQKVLYGKYAGTEFKLEEEELLITWYLAFARWKTARVRSGVTGRPRLSSHHTTLLSPLIGPTSISCRRPTRLAGTPE